MVRQKIFLGIRRFFYLLFVIFVLSLFRIGLDPDIMEARKWFERAAAQNDPEGLYNIGVMLANGQAGYKINHSEAFAYFKKSADSKKPFPMALHAVGNYLKFEEQFVNLTLARESFLKAADLDSPEV